MPIVKTIEVEINANKAARDLKGLDKGLSKVDKGVKDVGDSSKKSSNEVGVLGGSIDKMTGGGYSGFLKMTKAIRTGNVSLKAMKIALLATGLGAIVIVVAALAKNFGNSEEGANKLTKMLKQIGIVAGNVGDILYNLSQSVFSLLTFNLDDASESFNKATKQMSNFVQETKKEIGVQGELADKQAELTKIERQLTVERAEANKKRADLLDKSANKEKFSAKQRIEFLEEAAKIDEEITNKEIAAAKVRLEIKQVENGFSESSAEDLAEEAQLKADLINLDTARLMKAKTVTAQIVGAKREEAARLKAIRDSEAAAILEEQKLVDEAAALKKKTDIEALKLADEQKIINDKLEEDAKALKKKEAEDEHQRFLDMKAAERAALLQNLDTLISTSGEESKIGKALFLVKQGMLIKEQIMKAKATLTELGLIAAKGGADIASGAGATAKIGFPQNVPLLIAFAAQAAGIFSSIKSAVNAAKGSASKMGASGGGGSVSLPRISASAASLPPAFNVVGASETNQLAQSIGQEEKQPIKAFVVSNDVSDAQSLDRNIIESASIG
mgnify:CR=1 FL=1|jgi:hypothetical protein|tara:strand:+ start:4605 stop:6278 length:1674 start_codon:yes stop_codon:yes gene_type:complete